MKIKSCDFLTIDIDIKLDKESCKKNKINRKLLHEHISDFLQNTANMKINESKKIKIKTNSYQRIKLESQDIHDI